MTRTAPGRGGRRSIWLSLIHAHGRRVPKRVRLVMAGLAELLGPQLV